MSYLKLIDNKTVTKFKKAEDAARWAHVSFGPGCRILFRELLPHPNEVKPAMMDIYKDGQIVARVLF